MKEQEIKFKIAKEIAGRQLTKQGINDSTDAIYEILKEQLRLCGVGSSTYKIAISDSFCTYDFEMELPKTTCIRDIARRLYASFGLKEDNGRLRK